jgi:hypothetical protein
VASVRCNGLGRLGPSRRRTIEHYLLRPFAQQSNGKVERFFSSLPSPLEIAPWKNSSGTTITNDRISVSAA